MEYLSSATGTSSSVTSRSSNANCPACKKKLRATPNPLECRGCDRQFHLKCAQQSRDVILEGRRTNIWVCHLCNAPANIPRSGNQGNMPLAGTCKPARTSLKQNIKCIQWNCDHISSKKAELSEFISSHDPDVVLLQETKLTTDDPTPSFEGFNVVRKDRIYPRGVSARGGGLLTLIKKGIAYRHNASTPSNHMVEILTVEIISTRKTSVFISNVYISPARGSAEDGRDQRVDLSIIPVGHKHIIAGDFNAHSSSWDPYIAPDARGGLVEDWIDENDLVVINNGEATRYARNDFQSPTSAPDLTIVHGTMAHLTTWKAICDLGSDHIPLIFTFNEPFPIPKNKTSVRPNFNKANWDLFKLSITTDLEASSTEYTAKRMLEVWTSALTKVARLAIPSKVRRKRHTPWMNSHIKRLKKERNRLRRDLSHKRAEWVSKSKEVADLINTTKRSIWQKSIMQIEENKDAQQSWRLVKNLRGDSTRMEEDKCLVYNDRTCIGNESKANAFIQEYATISKMKTDKTTREEKVKLAKSLKERKFETPQEIEKAFSIEELLSAVQTLKKGKASGPDKIYPDMIRELPDIAYRWILEIFNLYWEKGECPQAWRSATIVPIIKKGKDPASVGSYRPISLTSCVGKLFEKMVKLRLVWWLEGNNRFSEWQAGFRTSRSTVDQCLRLSQHISDGFQQKPAKRTVLVLFDFQRAFDTVWREKLLTKMLSMGVPTKFVLYVKAWLVNRRAVVKIGEDYSRGRTFTAGLPQGAVLSPILFLIFINDLLSLFNDDTMVSAFADDLAIACSHQSKEEAQRMAQIETDKVIQWSLESRLQLNTNKCEAAFFSTSSNEARWTPTISINDAPIVHNPTPTFLGVTYDRTLSFSKHADNTAFKMNKRCNALRALSGTDWGWHRRSLRAVYVALQRSVAEYASPAWTPWTAKSHITKVERAQLKAARIITKAVASSPREAVLKEAELDTLEERYKRSAVKVADKWTHLPPEDPRAVLTGKQIRMRLKKADWRGTFVPLVRQLSERLPEQQAECKVSQWKPWTMTTRCRVIKARANKSMDVHLQRAAAEQAIADAGPVDLTIFTDGSVAGGGGCGGSGAVMFRNGTQIDSWAGAAGLVSSSFSAERKAIEKALLWLTERDDWSSCAIVTDSKSLIEAFQNRRQAAYNSLSEITNLIVKLEARDKALTMIWSPGHCGLLGNEVADAQAAIGAAMDQGDTTVDPRSRLNFIISNLPHADITHERVRRVYSCSIKAEEHTLSKADRTDLTRFRTGHHPKIRSYLQRIGKEEEATCRLCGEADETAEHLWTECPALELDRINNNTGTHINQLITQPGRAMTLLRTILRRII